MNRRDLLRTAGAAAALGLSHFPFGWQARADDAKKKRQLLVYTRSQTFEHSVVRPAKGKTKCLVEEVLTALGDTHGFEVTHTKDGRIFLNENLDKYDALFFETQGDLTKEGVDKQPPMPAEGKKAILDFVASGKGFAGAHCASDTFHSPGRAFENQDPANLDPYIKMLGGEFIRHGEQQGAWMRITDKRFPGATGLGDFGLWEEWYSLKNFSPDLHVILVQDNKGMHNYDYERPSFPATWARKHEQGRVFYTSMGHREDIWTNPIFKQLLLGGLQWAFGDVEADVTPNLKTAAPKADELPKAKK